jgi:hypothetical protein
MPISTIGSAGINQAADTTLCTTSGNVGVGATPSAWGSTVKAVQLPNGCAIARLGDGDFVVTQNAYFDNPNFKYASTTGVGSSIYRQVDGTHRWSYAASGTAGNNITFTEAMRIDSSGNLLVNGTATFSPSGGDAPKIYSVGALAIKSGSNIVAYSSDRINFNAATYYVLGSSTGGGVKLDNGTTAWAAQSDETTKDIIEPISNAIGKIGSLRAVIGKYKEDVEGTRRSFLIAQDVQTVLPEAVSTSSDGLLSLRYTEVIPLLVAAIKELKADLDATKAELAAMKGTA